MAWKRTEADFEVAIDGSPSDPKIVEIDAEVVARIIMAIAHARPKLAVEAANAIMDYLGAAMAHASSRM